MSPHGFTAMDTLGALALVGLFAGAVALLAFAVEWLIDKIDERRG